MNINPIDIVIGLIWVYFLIKGLIIREVEHSIKARQCNRLNHTELNINNFSHHRLQ